MWVGGWVERGWGAGRRAGEGSARLPAQASAAGMRAMQRTRLNRSGRNKPAFACGFNPLRMRVDRRRMDGL